MNNSSINSKAIRANLTYDEMYAEIVALESACYTFPTEQFHILLLKKEEALALKATTVLYTPVSMLLLRIETLLSVFYLLREVRYFREEAHTDESAKFQVLYQRALDLQSCFSKW